MAFGSNSKMFIAWIAALHGGSGASANKMPSSYTGLTVGTDTIKAALFNNSVTPDNTAAYGSTGYNTGTWTTTNEVIDSVGPGTNWAAGGRALGSMTSSVGTPGSSNVYTFDAADLAGGGNVTISNAYGCMIYDDSITGTNIVADQGICYNAFGSGQSVTAGTFTIVWNASGIFTITAS